MTVLRRITPKRFYATLHRLADGKRGATERAFLRALQAAKGKIDQDALRAAVESGNVEAILHALHVQDTLVPTLKAGLERQLGTIVATAKLSTDVMLTARVRALAIKPTQPKTWTVVDPGPTDYLRERSGALIRDITETTRTSIRKVLARGQTQGLTWKEKADQIESMIGLTERQAGWVEAYREKLLDTGGMDQELVDDFAARLVRQRAESIARTETMRAANAGHDMALKRRIDAGDLDADTLRRVWLVTPDDRLCPRCAAIPDMNPEGVGADEPFQTDEGPVDLPPLHPNCRCVTAIDVISTDWQRAIELVHGKAA